MPVRIIQRDGEVWFAAKDVCAVLGLTTRKIREIVPEDERTQSPLIDTLGREQKTTMVSESGLYTLIMRSDKPEAKRFQRWVTGEVLPSIRKTGSYLGAELEPLKLRAAELWRRKLDVVARVIAEQGLAPHWAELAEAMQGEMARCVCSARQGQLAPFPFSFARSEPPAAFCEEFFKRLLDRLSREI
ncbi:MAG: Bro-N domain-containing protein [Oligosphaeraceae bacterium]